MNENKTKKHALSRSALLLLALAMAAVAVFMGGFSVYKSKAAVSLEQKISLSFDDSSKDVVFEMNFDVTSTFFFGFYLWEGEHTDMTVNDFINSGGHISQGNNEYFNFVREFSTSVAKTYRLNLNSLKDSSDNPVYFDLTKTYTMLGLSFKPSSLVPQYYSNYYVYTPVEQRPFISNISLIGNTLSYTRNALTDFPSVPQYVYSVKDGAGLTAREIVAKVDNKEGYFGQAVLNNSGTVDFSSDLMASLFPSAGKYYCAFYSVGLGAGIDRYSTVFTYEKGVVPLPETPVKEGHTFVGWYLDEALTVPYSGQTITADTALYAKFTVNSYTVTYDCAGGNADKLTETFDWNSAVTPPSPTREGYDFKGWFIGGKQYNGEPLKADTTITAKWQIKTYTVTFMVDGAEYVKVTVEHGATFQQVMQENNLAYFHLLDDSGRAISKSESITQAVRTPIGEMTTEEKIATFIGNNWWVLWTLGGVAVAAVLVAVIAIVVAKKRA